MILKTESKAYIAGRITYIYLLDERGFYCEIWIGDEFYKLAWDYRK